MGSWLPPPSVPSPGLAAQRCRGRLPLPPSTCLADYRLDLCLRTEPAIALATKQALAIVSIASAPAAPEGAATRPPTQPSRSYELTSPRASTPSEVIARATPSLPHRGERWLGPPSGWQERLNVTSRDLVRARIDYPRMTAWKAPIFVSFGRPSLDLNAATPAP